MLRADPGRRSCRSFLRQPRSLFTRPGCMVLLISMWCSTIMPPRRALGPAVAPASWCRAAIATPAISSAPPKGAPQHFWDSDAAVCRRQTHGLVGVACASAASGQALPGLSPFIFIQRSCPAIYFSLHCLTIVVSRPSSGPSRYWVGVVCVHRLGPLRS